MEVARSIETLTDDGVPYPSDPDGMGVFAGEDGGSVLVTNHENSNLEPARVPTITGVTYDAQAIGGTSTVTVDKIGNRRRHLHQPRRDRQQLRRRSDALGYLADV